MQEKKSLVYPLSLVFLSILIHWLSGLSFLISPFYTQQFYPSYSKCLRLLTGWLPISLGDLLYGGAAIGLLYQLFRLIRAVIKRQLAAIQWKKIARRAIIRICWIYIIFNLQWGLNYNRPPVTGEFQLSAQPYTKSDLIQINELLLQKVNSYKSFLVSHPAAAPSSQQLFKQAMDAYQVAQQLHPQLRYHRLSVKPSLWGWLGNYLGFTGYYNPFTGEAQVNTTVPYFLQPYTTCHEMAHQLGYAKENEANFVGFLAASHSADSLFRYSVYLDLFIYANRNLYGTDSSLAKNMAGQLSPQVKADLLTWRRFNEQHKNPIEPFIRWLYGRYLQSNQQPSGVLSYDEVTGLVIAYYHQYHYL